MRYIRPFHFDRMAPGERSDWLLAPAEKVGCGIRLARGGGAANVPARDLLALVLAGTAELQADDKTTGAPAGSLIIVPGGQGGAVGGDSEAYWIEIEADADGPASDTTARVIEIDQGRFEGAGFAYQSLADRSSGVTSMKINTLQVQPGAGSPDFHIHAFAQIYVIQEGEMTIDIGRDRKVAPANSIVVLPPGVVHRNFNASGSVERHVSLLVPEPAEGEIFDFAVDIHPEEAELMTAIPA